VATPDRWLVLTAHTPENDPIRDLVAEGLLALGGLSVLEGREDLTTYLLPPQDPEAWLREASRFLREWVADEPPRLTWRWQPNEDWEREWRRGLAPRKVSNRLIVKPSWTEWEASPGEVVVQIDPQMAFGTGEHATTRSCLRLLDDALRPGDRVLDIGSGSGILAIAAALLGAREVVAVESDPDANLNARDNFVLNCAADRIQLHERLADAPLLASLGFFDVILANILSGVIRPLLPALRDALAPGGRLIVSGILDRERDEVVAAAETAGLGLRREELEEEWWSGLMAGMR
jgi:ribosomal protein L11 methyltransferase